MNNQFADYETANILKELGFKERCLAVIDSGGMVYRDDKPINSSQEHTTSPLWQQIEQWLWEKHKIEIWFVGVGDKFKYSIIKQRKQIIGCQSYLYDSPLDARRFGIKQAVKYLHDKK